jgi:hypothetical protein
MPACPYRASRPGNSPGGRLWSIRNSLMSLMPAIVLFKAVEMMGRCRSNPKHHRNDKMSYEWNQLGETWIFRARWEVVIRFQLGPDPGVTCWSPGPHYCAKVRGVIDGQHEVATYGFTPRVRVAHLHYRHNHKRRTDHRTGGIARPRSCGHVADRPSGHPEEYFRDPNSPGLYACNGVAQPLARQSVTKGRTLTAGVVWVTNPYVRCAINGTCGVPTANQAL